MRGWGPEAFKRAKPEFMDAVRWGLFLEKAVPILAGWKQIEAMVVSGDTPNLPEILRQKHDAAEIIPMLTELIYPDE